MRVLAVLIALSAFVAVARVGTGLATTTASNPCAKELPATLAVQCVAPGVTCIVKSDAHHRWEAVYGTEPTMAHAQATLALARHRGLDAAIEVDIRCSNGAGVYEVGKARFTSRPPAAALVAKAKAAGFGSARTEDS